VPCQRRPSQNWLWGPKLLHVQNLGGGFAVFFLGGQNRNFEKVRGLKFLLNLQYNHKCQCRAGVGHLDISSIRSICVTELARKFMLSL